MVRLLGFVALIALVALVLLWSSEHFTPRTPTPEKAAAPTPDIQQVIPPQAPAQEAPPPAQPEVAVAAADAGGTAPQPAPVAPDREAPSPPVDAPAAEAPPETPTVAPPAEPSAETRAGGAPEAAPATAQEPAPANTAPGAETPASGSSPASEPAPAPGPSPESSTIAYAQPADGDTAGASSPRAPASGDPPPRPASPATGQAEAAGVRIEERLIAEEEFVALEQAQGRIDERTDAQRRHQEEDGWYGWGVLNEYADPDRAARLLGGVPVVRAGGRFHTMRERAGQIRVRPIGNVSAAYGAVGLRAHDPALKQLMRRAIASGLLLGREADHELLHLFPRQEAAHLGNKVVKVFECHLRESGLRGEAADRFRKQAKLRGAVVALRRASGGRLGVLLPRYFRTGEGRVPVAAPCREIDEESRRAALAMAAPPAAAPAPGGG